MVSTVLRPLVEVVLSHATWRPVIHSVLLTLPTILILIHSHEVW